MKRKISLILALAVALTALVLPTSVSAFATQIVKINGADKISVTNVAEAFETPNAEDTDSYWDMTCKTGAVLTVLDDMADVIIFHTIHDPENGSSSGNVIPEGYTFQDLNEHGQFMDLPKGGRFVFDERGMYYYDIWFEDGTNAIGYVYVDDNAVAMAPSTPVTPAEPETELIPVVSKAQRLQIEEEWTDVDAYNIYDNNYIKLRDFAYFYSMFCSLTNKHFDVTWDGEKNAINLVTGKSYTEVGGEGKLNAGVSASAVLSSSAVYLNGEYVPLTAYNINGNNYFKLRDLCEALDISISWWGVQQIIYINNDYPYGTEFEEIVPDAM